VEKDQEKNVSEKIILFYFSVVSAGCTIWPLTLGKEDNLRIFRNRVLKKWETRGKNAQVN